jgi:hypothetical protein
MATVISLCNLALAHLGEEGTLSSIDPPEGSVYADYCAQFYPIARDTVLSAPPNGWNFNTKRASLALLGTPPTAWQFSYAYPNDVLRILGLHFPEDPDDKSPQPFVCENASNGVRVIYTNVDDAILRYSYTNTDVSRYPIEVGKAIARLLASYLAGPIIKGASGVNVSRGQLELYRGELAEAMAQDAGNMHNNEYRDFIPESMKARA